MNDSLQSTRSSCWRSMYSLCRMSRGSFRRWTRIHDSRYILLNIQSHSQSNR